MSAARPPRGAAFRAVPDDSRVAVRLGPDGAPQVQLPGHWDLPALHEPSQARAYPELWHLPGTPFDLPRGTQAVVNLCAAPDACETGMQALDEALAAETAVLNHPRAVTLARRDLAQVVFRPLAGLRVPAALRFVADSPGAFAFAFAGGGFRFPVRLSVAGAHPATARLVGGPEGWDTLLRGDWGRRVWVMEQAGTTPVPWRLMLGMVGRTGHAEVFDAGVLPAPGPAPRVAPDFVQSLARAACECLPLDVWTLVVALDPAGPVFDFALAGLPEARLAEAAGLDRAARRVAKALLAPAAGLLGDPAAWRCAAGGAARLPPVAAHATGRLT
jgi:hypothetical protein